MPTLFCGVKITPGLESALASISPKLFGQYIGPDSGQLLQIERDQALYLGKYLDSSFPYSELTLQESNIHSILKKLVPEYSAQKHPVLLFPVEQGNA